MNYKEYIGVDVSKLTLDYHLFTSQTDQKIENKKAEISHFLSDLILKHGDQILVLCEATGGYEKLLVESCHGKSIDVVVVQPIQARAFAKALNLRAKTDKIDAKALCLFARQMSDSLVKAKSYPAIEELRSLVRRRHDLVERKVALGNQMDKLHDQDFLITSYKEELTTLKILIKRIETEIISCIKENETLKIHFSLLQSIQGIGPKVAYEMLAELPEVLDLEPKQLTALVGLAPMNRDSGKFSGKRRIQGGRKQIRKALYMAAVTAVRYENDLKKTFDHLIKKGKPFKVAITAICRKILLMAQAVLKRNSPWIANYV